VGGRKPASGDRRARHGIPGESSEAVAAAGRRQQPVGRDFERASQPQKGSDGQVTTAAFDRGEVRGRDESPPRDLGLCEAARQPEAEQIIGNRRHESYYYHK
jgi:hypothetical protein